MRAVLFCMCWSQMATLKCPGLGAVGFVIFTFDDYAPVAEMARCATMPCAWVGVSGYCCVRLDNVQSPFVRGGFERCGCQQMTP